MSQATGVGGARGLWAYRDLITNLVRKDLRVRYMGSLLGFGWSLVNPLVVTLTYLIVFTYLFRTGIPHYPLFLVAGILHWNLFAVVASQSSELLVSNANILKKMRFPRVAVPVAGMLVNLSFWASGLVVFAALFTFLGGKATPYLALYPVYLALYVLLIFGFSLILSVVYVEFRDSKHLVEVLLQVLFWATPVVYSLQQAPTILHKVLLFNPFTSALLSFQAIFYRGAMPSLRTTETLVAWTLVSLTIGLLVFRRTPKLIELL